MNKFLKAIFFTIFPIIIVSSLFEIFKYFELSMEVVEKITLASLIFIFFIMNILIFSINKKEK